MPKENEKITSHLYAAITQDLVQLIVPDAPYPIVFVDHYIPFPRQLQNLEIKEVEQSTYDLDEAAVKELVSRARAGDEDELLKQVREFISEVNVIVDSIAEHKKRCAESEEPINWEGPSDEEIENFRAMDFPVAVHLSYVYVAVEGPPSIHLSGQSTNIDGVRVRTKATIEFWWKVPKIVGCIAHCPWPLNHKCCIPKIDFVWSQKGHISASTELMSDITINAVLENNSIWLSGLFRKLRINEAYFDKIPLEDVANPIVKKKRKEVFKLADLLATIPVIDHTYGIKGVMISGVNELRVDVEVQKIE